MDHPAQGERLDRLVAEARVAARRVAFVAAELAEHSPSAATRLSFAASTIDEACALVPVRELPEAAA